VSFQRLVGGGDIAYEVLKEIIDGHEPFDVSILVDDERHMCPRCLEQLEQAKSGNRAGHRFEQLVDSGEMRDYADIARLGRVSRARVSQILKLLALAPSIQEYILFLPPRIPGQPRITERDLRQVVKETGWDRQRKMFGHLIETRTQKVNS
jgi:hypothetical protein